MMNINISSRPFLGVIVLFVLLLCLFYVADIDSKDLMSTKGFKKVYDEKPWMIYLAIAITLYAVVSMATYVSTEKKQIKTMTEKFDNSNTTSFIDFLNKLDNDNVDNDLDNDLVNNLDNDLDDDDKINKYLVFWTTINNSKYYLVMRSDPENNTENSSESLKPSGCLINGRYVRPVLLREDKLKKEYDDYLNLLSNENKNQDKKYMSNYIQHFVANPINIDDIDDINRVENKDAHIISGMYKEQLLNFADRDDQIPVNINASQTFSKIKKYDNPLERIFLCGNQTISYTDNGNAIFVESLITQGTQNQVDNPDNQVNNILMNDTIKASNIAKSKIRMYFVDDGLKHYFVSIPSQSSETYSIGIVPESSIKDFSQNNDMMRIDFNVSAVKLEK